MRGEPTYTGANGQRAWVVEREKKADDPADWGGALIQIQMHVPGAHPFWSWWVANCVHLRPIEGVRPASKHYPEAEYELTFIALDPDKPVPDPDGSNMKEVRYAYLQPVDLVYQFHGLNDEQAKELARLAVKLIMAGRMSPDSDFRRAWKELLKNTIEHMALGGHPDKENPS